MRPSSQTQRLLLIFLILSSLLLAALIVADWLPYLRGPAPETSEWYWPYYLRPVSLWWPSIFAAGLMWAVSTWWLTPEKTKRRQDILAISGLIVVSFILQLALIYADRADVAAELVDRTLSNLSSGFFEPAAEIEDINAVLREYPQQMPLFASEHAQTHPPGLIVGNWLTINFMSYWPDLSEVIAQRVRPLRCTDLWLLDRPPEVAAALAIWSLLPLLAASLVAIPAYGFARFLLRGRSLRLAVILAASIPSLLLFSPKSVQLYALLVLILLWIFQSAMSKGSLWRFLMAGIILSLMTYLSLGNAVLYPLLLFYAVLSTGYTQIMNDSQKAWTNLIKQLFIFSLGASTFWLISWLLWQAPPWAVARAGLQQHYILVTNIRRYDWWAAWNLIDLILFSGWPLALGFAGSVFLAVKAWRMKKLQQVDVLAVCLLILIVILNLSGSARGEVGRIWLFFLPLLAFPAAQFWNTVFPQKRNIWIVVALQLLMIIVIGLAWRPVRAVIVVAQEPEIPLTSPDVEIDTGFANQPFSLNGFSINPTHIQAGEQINLSLFWEAEGPSQKPYTVFNHLIDESGTLVSQQDNWPVNGSWPATCWRNGDQIIDTYTISIPENLSAGRYDLYSGIYDANTNERVPIEDRGDSIHLSEIFITTP